MDDLDNTKPTPPLQKSFDADSFSIDPDTFYWTYQAIKLFFKFLKLKIQTHGNEAAWNNGDIFLFNHFARFEAIIPQYLIFQKTNTLSRSIATKELFSANNMISKYLINLGAIPNDSEQLMYHVSKDIFNGMKLVAFPEGGIVKDRRVLDKKGKYSIYSRSNDKRRKLHTGPAVIGLTIAIFKAGVRQLDKDNKHSIIERWAQEIGLENAKELTQACGRPTTIIPCNITFYPLRVKDNALISGLNFFHADLKDRLSEELLIEGNLLLKNTDMDIQVQQPIIVEEYWSRWEATIASKLVDHSKHSLFELFNRQHKESTWGNYLYNTAHRRNTLKIRDAYMHSIYSGVTINIAHLASTLLVHFVKQDKVHVNKKKLHELLYVATKLLQKNESLNLHGTLKKPATYRNILFKNTKGFNQFLRSILAANLIKKKGAYYLFTGLLLDKPHFDSIRFQNPVTVYANEVAPIADVQQSIKECLVFKPNKHQDMLAEMLFEDELLEYRLDTEKFQQEKYNTFADTTPISPDAEPYLLKPKKFNGQCAILIHGLLSSPTELKSLAKKLLQTGYIVLGVRLKGHGTSPWDLHQCKWQDWQQSIKQSIKIARCYSKSIHLVGFSSGALLALHFSANSHYNFTSVSACCTPIKFKDPLVSLINLADSTNKIIKKISGGEGIFPFKDNAPEHPHINYNYIPISSVNELLKLIKATIPRLKKISCPVYLIQADNDPVVDSNSMETLLNAINDKYRQYDWIPSNRHGILYENTANCQQKIIDFIASHKQIA